MLVTERYGRITAIYADGSRTAWAEFDVYGEAAGIGPESGLLGIALDPDFARTGYVFVIATTITTREVDSPLDRMRCCTSRKAMGCSPRSPQTRALR